MSVSLLDLREALEASWSPETANLKISAADNPALGNCYPTARVVQHFFPELEIVEGEVKTPLKMEKHFWNLLNASGTEYHIDLSWQQFQHGSKVMKWKVREREALGDSKQTVKRVEILLGRVKKYLAKADKL